MPAFVLDTNILSAMMQSRRVPEVAMWMAQHDETDLFTTAISYAEILSGLSVLPPDRRRNNLETTARFMFAEFEGRVLPFDQDAATIYAELFATRRQAGRPASALDLMIASIARSNAAAIVTRDVNGFEDCGLTLINPWEPSL